MNQEQYPPGILPNSRATANQLWESLVTQQNELDERKTDIFRNIVDRNEILGEEFNKSIQEVDQLRKEVALWRKAYLQDQQEFEHAKEEATVLKQQLANYDGPKSRDPVVLALIDGDGYIFKNELLKRGLDGGREAAQMLIENILTHVSNGGQCGPRVELWTYVFFNLKGLQQTLVRFDICTGDEFEAFVMGFNKASPRFTINDVHWGKEAADAKIKAYLYTWTRFPQTLKIYFGGAHDNGYYPTLAELQSEGLLDKLTLLHGYQEVAAEIRSLHLPNLKIDNLFRSEKLPSKLTSAALPAVTMPLSPLSSPVNSPKMLFANVVETTRPSQQPRPASNSTSSSPTNARARHLNPNLDLHKHQPPPCNMFYLDTCSKGASCKYGHDYILEAHHYEILRENSKKSPCPAVNRDSPCPFGDQCRLGHKCPQGPQCFYRKLDKCKFQGKSMHTA